MAITQFQQTIWSKKIQTILDTLTGLKNHSDYQYEGEVKLAKELKILGVTRPTIKTYVPGTAITREQGTDSSQMLKIDQFRYFDFEVEDIDQAQSVPGLMDTLTAEASKGLAEEADKYIAKIVKDDIETSGEGNTIKGISTSTAITKSNIIETIEKGFEYLYTQNCKTTDTYHLEVSPKFFTTLRPALTELYTDNVEMSKKGFVGKYGNALVSIENNLSGDETDKYCILRTTKAIAYAGQIDKVEAFRPHDGFADALKGLFVFGAKIVRPEQIYVIKAH